MKKPSVIKSRGADGEGARAPARAPEFWRLEPHICRHCHSRLASTPDATGKLRYHCTNCGAEAVGATAEALCCCGLKVRRPGKPGAPPDLIDAGIRCRLNPSPNPEFPSIYIATEGPAN